MVEAVGKLEWNDGILSASSPNIPPLTWQRPADLAEARLEIDPPVGKLEVDDGEDLLKAAFEVLPFVREPLPKPVWGEALTPAAREAFTLLLGQNVADRADAFRVTRGEVGEFLVCARRYKGVWKVGGFTSGPMTLTVRFEDLWDQLPKNEKYTDYMVEVLRDPNAKDATDAKEVREVLTGIAPDARICLDLAVNGGFTLTFWPVAAKA